MSFLNLNYGIISYKDPSPTNPTVRFGGDVSKSYQGVATSKANSKELPLGPGESGEIVTTLRSLGIDATTELEFYRPYTTEDSIRMKWTGVGSNPAFRTKRSLGVDATTEITTTRVSPNAVRLQSTSGTAMVTTAVQVGDILKLEKNTDTFTSPFNPTNIGRMFTVQAKGVDYVDIIDNQMFMLEQNPITLGADFDFVLRVFSNGPVKVGDTVNIDGTTVNPSNKGSYTIIDLSSDYIEYVNSYGVTETITNTSDLIKLYDYLIGFVHIIGVGSFLLKINDQTPIEVGTLNGIESVFLGSVKAWKVEAINNNDCQITLDAQFAAVSK